MDWECPCPACMGTLEPPDSEPTEAELEVMEREAWEADMAYWEEQQRLDDYQRSLDEGPYDD